MISNNTKTENTQDQIKNLVQYCKEITIAEAKVELQQKILEYSQLVLTTRVQMVQLQQSYRILTMENDMNKQLKQMAIVQRDFYYVSCQTLKKQIIQQQKITEMILKQKETEISQYQSDKNQIKLKISTIMQEKQNERNLYQQSLRKNSEKYIKKFNDLNQQFSTLKQANEKLNQQYLITKQKYDQFQEIMLSLKQSEGQNIPQIFMISQSQNEEGQANLGNKKDNVTEYLKQFIEYKIKLEEQLKNIKQFIVQKQGTYRFSNSSFTLRIQQLLNREIVKFNKAVKNLQQLQIGLNKQLKLLNKSHQSVYGSQLLQKLKSKLIDQNSSIMSLQTKLNQEIGKKCKDCEMKQNQITSLNQQIRNQKKIMMNISKDHQQKINNYQQLLKQKQEKEKQLIQQQRINKEQLQESIRVLKNKSIIQQDEIKKQLQSLSQQKQSYKKSIIQIQKKYQQEQIESSKKSSYLKQLQNQILDLQNNLKNLEHASKQLQEGKEKIVRIQKQLKQKQQTVRKLKNENEKLSENNNILASKITQTQGNLAIRNNQILQIQNQICEIANRQQKKKDIQGPIFNSYKQALLAINEFLEPSSNKPTSSLFNIPSLAQNFQDNIQWVANVIDSYCFKGTKFTTKFISKNDEFFRDFSKVINAKTVCPNLLIICCTQKGAIFCIFIPRLTVAIKDTDPIVIFNPQKKIRCPLQNKKVVGVRPSLMDPQGAFVFGRQQITLTKLMDFKINYNVKDGYFSQMSAKQMFGIDSQNQQIILQKIEFHQIIFD